MNGYWSDNINPRSMCFLNEDDCCFCDNKRMCRREDDGIDCAFSYPTEEEYIKDHIEEMYNPRWEYR